MGLRIIKNRKAFTLIELLVVIAIVALLLAILMPSLAKARDNGKHVVCLNNLRQMAIAAKTYTHNNEDRFPLAQIITYSDGLEYKTSWDYDKTLKSGQEIERKAGLLWQGEASSQIQQCPIFKGAANSAGDQHTGYNYNASYIGGIYSTNFMTGNLEGKNSSKEAQVARPSECAVFGDGQFSNGANKFMRSPFVGKLDTSYVSIRPYGTQGFRHSGNTNVAYADGSVAVVKKRHVETYASIKSNVAEGTGFLSADNRAYDLK